MWHWCGSKDRQQRRTAIEEGSRASAEGPECVARTCRGSGYPGQNVWHARAEAEAIRATHKRHSPVLFGRSTNGIRLAIRAIHKRHSPGYPGDPQTAFAWLFG
eukprot:62866-Chlamydomonas_euryale.AAC.1